MTPHELAEKLAPYVREAAERSKTDILSHLPPVKRAMAKALWGSAMQHGIPAELRIAIELAIGKYQEYLEPYMGDILESIKPLIDVKTHPELLLLVDILEMLATKKATFDPAVQATLAHAPLPVESD